MKKGEDSCLFEGETYLKETEKKQLEKKRKQDDMVKNYEEKEL